MNIKRLKALLPYLAQANIPAWIWGHHGIGKSQSVKQLAAELTYDHPTRGRVPYSFYDLRVGSMDVGDLVGLADFVKDENGKNIGIDFLPPIHLLPRDPHEKGFLFLDEINLAKKEMHNSLFSLILDGFMGSYKKPKGIYLISAGNPDTEDYDVTHVFSKALMSRFCHLKLENDIECWIEYAMENKVDVDVINLIQDQRPVFIKADFNIDVEPDNRSLFSLDRLIKTGIPEDLLTEELIGSRCMPLSAA